jgi:RNA polymerase sigma-70 factor (ECF subfamily)
VKSQSQSDSSLFHRAAAGDVASIQALLAQHHDRILQYVRKNFPADLKTVLEPEDIVQDVFFEACRLLSGFDPQGEDAFARWIVTIARHRIIDLVRMYRAHKRGRAGTHSGEDAGIEEGLAQLAVHRRTPSQSAASHEFLAAMERGLQRIPADYRQAVVLRHIEGLSVAETAERMKRTHDAVYLLCSRGLSALRSELRSISLYR